MLGVDQLGLVLGQFLQVDEECATVIKMHLHNLLSSSVHQEFQPELVVLLETGLGERVSDLVF